MPYELLHKGKCWSVVNSETGKEHAKCTSKAKAQAQMKLLYGVESGTWQPTGKKVADEMAGGGIGPGEQPLIRKMHIPSNPVVRIAQASQPHTIGVGIGQQYDTFLSPKHPAQHPKAKSPLFPQA